MRPAALICTLAPIARTWASGLGLWRPFLTALGVAARDRRPGDSPDVPRPARRGQALSGPGLPRQVRPSDPGDKE